MKNKIFLGRVFELSCLNEELKKDTSSFVVIHGRRRVGKTRLLNEFCKNKPALRFEGLEVGDTSSQIAHFLKQLGEQTKNSLLSKIKCQSWDEALDLLTREIKGSRKIVVFDEFPWMIEKNREIVALFKYYWDNKWAPKKIMMIFCGSVNTFMVQDLIFSSAFYGRVDCEILLKPLSAGESRQFLGEKKSVREALDLYLVFGGMPRYLEEINPRESAVQNINRLCFTRDSFFTKEFQRLFHDEFGKIKIYSKIVKLLSRSSSLSYTEILHGLKAEVGGGYKEYLNHLEQAQFIQPFTPFDKKGGTSLVRYRLVDEYLLFYFRFIEPNLDFINENTGENYFLHFLGKPVWTSWTGLAFERFCLKHVKKIQEILKIDQLTKRYGSYFSRKTTAKNGFQIDLLFERHDRVLSVCEMKYTSKPVGTEVIYAMEKKIGLLDTGSNWSVEKILITASPPAKTLRDQNYFNRIIQVEELL